MFVLGIQTRGSRACSASALAHRPISAAGKHILPPPLQELLVLWPLLLRPAWLSCFPFSFRFHKDADTQRTTKLLSTCHLLPTALGTSAHQPLQALFGPGSWEHKPLGEPPGNYKTLAVLSLLLFLVSAQAPSSVTALVFQALWSVLETLQAHRAVETFICQLIKLCIKYFDSTPMHKVFA